LSPALFQHSAAYYQSRKGREQWHIDKGIDFVVFLKGGIQSSQRTAPPDSQPITTLETPAIDRLHGKLRLSFGNDDSQIAAALGAGALKVLGQSATSLRQAFVHHDTGNLQPEPFHQFFDADGELMKLKAGDSHD
jgi:hypothetical protein